MQKNIQITNVEKFKEDPNWTLFKVKCSGDNDMVEFKTFEDHSGVVGQQYQGHFEYSEQYKNWSEISKKKAEENAKQEEIMEGLRKVWDKIDEVEKKIDALGVPRTEETLKQGELEEPIREEK